MFEIPVLPSVGDLSHAVLSRGFWEVGMAVVCSFKDLKRESKSRGYSGSRPAQCLTAGSFHMQSYDAMNLEEALHCGKVWVGFSLLWFAEVLECPLKCSYSSFEQMSKSLWVWSYPKYLYSESFVPFPPTVHISGHYLGRLMTWTGHKILGHSGPGSVPLSSYGKSGKSLNLPDSLTEWSL